MPPLLDTLEGMIGFGTNDTLSLSSSEALEKTILHLLQSNSNFSMGSMSPRVYKDTRQYLIDIERDLADFHGTETGKFFNSGHDANSAVWSTLTQLEDIVLYDEYVNASIHDGMRRGRARNVQFRHNDPCSLRDCLKDIVLNTPDIAKGKSVVFIALESFYSMGGDIAPVREFIKIVNQELPLLNYIFSIDETHSNGLVGPNGAGLVCYYGLETEFTIRLHTCGKALGLTGGKRLCLSPSRSR